MKKVFELAPLDEIRGLTAFRQYSDDQAIENFFYILRQFLYERMQTTIDLIPQRSWRYNEKENLYMQFYWSNLFNFQRGFGEARVQNLYDEHKIYDNGIIYDDTTFTGLLDLNEYKILVKYFFDYCYNGFTLTWLYSLVQEFCRTSDFNFRFELSTIWIDIKASTFSRLLLNVFVDKQNFYNVPLANIKVNLL